MTDFTQTPEYAALQAAKEARDSAYGNNAIAEKAYLAAALFEGDGEIAVIYETSGRYLAAHKDTVQADAMVDIAQAAFDAAYPAPTDVNDAVKAAVTARAKHALETGNLTASYSDEQLAMIKAISAAQAELEAAVTVAKAAILAHGASPVKAFVYKRSVRDTVSVQADRDRIIKSILKGVLPDSLISITDATLLDWFNESPSEAEIFGITVTRESVTTPSVAYYAAKL